MARDKILFIASFVCLGLLVAILFGRNKQPPPSSEKPAQAAVDEVKEKKPEYLPLAEGMVAVPVQLNNRSSVVQFMAPGTLIDIRFNSKANLTPETVSLILLKNIRILSIGKDSEGKQYAEKGAFYKPNSPIEILLEMTPDQAEVLSYAEMSGNISFEIVKGNLPYKHDELTEKLLKSKSDENFNSILVTYMIQSLFPGAQVNVTVTGKSFIISGKVADGVLADNLIKILNVLAPEGEKSVVNLLEFNEFVEVLSANMELKVGNHLTPKDYRWTKIRMEELSPTLITRNVQTDKWLEGATIARQMHSGELINRSDIVWPHEAPERSLFEQLTLAPGKRIVSVELNTKTPIVQFLHPDTLVDVKFTSKSDVGISPLSLVLWKNIRVLAIRKGDSRKNLDGNESFYKPGLPLEVFLEMTPQQADVFSYAQQTGSISLELQQPNECSCDTTLARSLMCSKSLNEFQSILVSYMVRSLFPEIRISIMATPRGFIVRGRVPDPQIGGKIMEIFAKLIPGGTEKTVVNMMDVQPQQVLLAVKFYEVTTGLVSRVGVNWRVLFQAGGQILGFGAVFPSPPPTDPNYFLNASRTAGNWDLSALLDMLEEDTFTKILAEPNLTTVSGESAHFFAGGEFPILIPQGGNLIGTVTVEFKKFGVSLDFTPLVDLNGLITLRVMPEVSDIDRTLSVVLNGFVIPGLRSRKADTTVKLWPGQSYLIAGLYLGQELNVNDNLYGLNKIPILGSLFNSNRYEDHRTELMIIVTPYLIQDNSGYEWEWEMDEIADVSDGEQCVENGIECVETPWETAGIFDYSQPCCDQVNSTFNYPSTY